MPPDAFVSVSGGGASHFVPRIFLGDSGGVKLFNDANPVAGTVADVPGVVSPFNNVSGGCKELALLDVLDGQLVSYAGLVGETAEASSR